METIPKGTGGFLQPEKVLAQLQIASDISVADFGCGHGYFTAPLSRMVGKNGRVFAVDVLAEALEAVRSRAQMDNLLNIETIRGNLETADGSKLLADSVDLVLLHNVLFQSQKKSGIIKETKRVLKSSGVFVLVDWLPSAKQGTLDQPVMGPNEGWRISAQEAKDLAQAQDFVFKSEIDAGQFHYGLIFIKP